MSAVVKKVVNGDNQPLTLPRRKAAVPTVQDGSPPGISAGNTGLVPARAGPDGHHPIAVALQAWVPAAPRSCPYKGGWYGTRVVEAGQWFPSSKTCSCCGVVNGDLDREPDWDCAECGAHHDRNENAARNLRKLALLAVGEEVMLPDEGRTKHDAK